MRFGEGGQPDLLSFAGLRGGGKGGGGGSSGSSWNYSSTNVPDWLNNASQSAVGQAQQIAARPYDPYTGQMVAGPTADTTQAYQQIRDMQGMTNPAYNQATGAWQGVLGNLRSVTPDQINALTNQLYGNYGQNVINPTAGLLSGYLGQGPATAGDVANNAMTLMTPYSQAVIDPALQIGRQQLAQNLQTIGAGANQAGAFGGSRQGIMEGTAQAQAAVGAGQTIGNLLQSGWNTAMTPATQLALQQGQQGYNATTALAGLLGTGYNQANTQAGNIANTNLALGTSAAQQIPALAQQQATQAQRDASLMQTIGAAEQTQQQNVLNSQLGQFYEQQNWPTQNLDVLLSAVGAVPYGTTSISYGGNQAQQQQSRNVAGGIMGGAASGAAIGAMFGGVGAPIGAVAGGILGAL